MAPKKISFATWLERNPDISMKQIERDTEIGYTSLNRAKSGAEAIRYPTAKRLVEYCEKHGRGPAPDLDLLLAPPSASTGTDG